MYFLKWAVVGVTSPFWLPIVLFSVALCILVLGSILIVSLALCLGIVIWVLKLFFVTYMGLIKARREVLQEIGNGLNQVPWWRLLRMVLSKHIKRLKELKQSYENYGEIDYDDE